MAHQQVGERVAKLVRQNLGMKRVALVGIALLMAGCAKFPENGGTNTTHVVFRMRVSREINPNYLYYVAIRTSTDPNPDSNGPIPVASYPAKNGFVAGQPTHFVSFNPYIARPFTVSKFNTRTPDASDTNPIDLTSWTDVAIPLNYTTYADGIKELSFEISLDQLTGGNIPDANALKSMQINFLTMNNRSTSSSSNRVFDALGNSTSSTDINTFLKVPLSYSATYSNSTTTINEPANDTVGGNDPDLDIVDWSVEVRTP